MTWSIGIESSSVHLGESLGLEKKLGVGPDPVAEAKSGAAGGSGVKTVASQKYPDIASGKWYFGQRRSEHPRLSHVSPLRGCLSLGRRPFSRRTPPPGVSPSPSAPA
jgi:hypothetical protein